jgi:hypothetical protein
MQLPKMTVIHSSDCKRKELSELPDSCGPPLERWLANVGDFPESYDVAMLCFHEALDLVPSLWAHSCGVVQRAAARWAGGPHAADRAPLQPWIHATPVEDVLTGKSTSLLLCLQLL